MSNWCENLLTVYGKSKELKRFRKNAKNVDTELSIKALHKMPQDAHEHCWLLENFDVEADFEAQIDVGKTHLAYYFYTPDNPPLTWLKKISVGYPCLRFKLTYLADDVEGKQQVIFQNGKI